VPRRHWDIEFTGSQFSVPFDSAAHLMMGFVGVGATLAFTGLIIFVLLTVWAVFLGKSNAGKPMEGW
jgi:cytochrome c oxidase subunit 1